MTLNGVTITKDSDIRNTIRMQLFVGWVYRKIQVERGLLGKEKVHL